MNPNDAANTLLNTDYPSDKVLAYFSGSFSAIARYGSFQPRRTTVTINHSIGDWGLIVGAYSTDGGSSWLPFGITEANTSGSVPTFQTIECTARCRTSDFSVLASNYTTSSTSVMYALYIMSRE